MLFHNSCIEIVSFSWKKKIILFYSFFAIIYLKNSSWIIISSVVSASQEYTLYKSLFYFLVLMNIYLHSQFGFFFFPFKWSFARLWFYESRGEETKTALILGDHSSTCGSDPTRDFSVGLTGHGRIGDGYIYAHQLMTIIFVLVFL